MKTTIPYKPRSLFRPYHERTERFAKIVAHRRFGKTVGTINDMIRSAARNKREYPPPRYAYVAPTYGQAKDVAWSYLKHYAAPIDGLIVSESELWVEYPTGARIRLYGADNYDRMRGLYLDGVAIDEPAQIDPQAWPTVIRPTLSDYQGWATFIGTPRGRDWFYRIDRDENGIELPGWFRLVLRASETGIISEFELAANRRDLSEDQYAQEFECSFDAAVRGAYFAMLLSAAEAQGRIGPVAADPILPLQAFFDIGGAGKQADAMAIWICQFVGQTVRVLDYIEGRSQVLAYYVNELRRKGYGGAICHFPHDGVNANNVTGKRYVDHWREAGFECTEPMPNQGKGASMMRVEAVRRLMPSIWFNADTTAAGREALIYYHEHTDEKRNIGLGPEHDWSSHAADAFGLMALCYEAPEREREAARPPAMAGGWMS
jgi:phage terminase large subunit